MMDSFLLVAPILLFLVVELLVFVGCDLVFPLHGFESTPLFRKNCGGPAVVDAGVGWDDDSDPNPASVPNKGFPLANAGSPVIDPSNGQPAGAIYETCRFGNPGISYQFLTGQGTFNVTLKFAQISGNPNLQGAFAFKIDGGDPQTLEETAFDVVQKAGAAGAKFDYLGQNVSVSAAGVLTITFSEAQNQGNFPFVNAIEIDQVKQM